MGTATFDFDGETAIVTGGSSGIGREIAVRFGDAGATVIVADVREDPKDADETMPTHEAIEEAGGEAIHAQTDVSDPAALEATVDLAHEYGGVDVMVNNAGIFHGDSIREIELEDLRRMYEVNVLGVVFGTKTAANDMIDRGIEGSVINVASISSVMAQSGMVGYNATKGGVRMATRCAALDLGEYDIRVNAIAPGSVVTEIVEGRTEVKSGDDGTADDIPLGRASWPADLGGAVLFLASEEADYVTGEIFFVDGGVSLSAA